MRADALALLSLVLATSPALALEDHLSCEPAAVQKFRISGNHKRLRLRATFTPATGFTFDPTVNGLYLELAYEPEADPANVAQAASLAASRFRHSGQGFSTATPPVRRPASSCSR